MPLGPTPRENCFPRLAGTSKNGPTCCGGRNRRASVREKSTQTKQCFRRQKPPPAISSKTKMPLGTIKLSKISRPAVAQVQWTRAEALRQTLPKPLPPEPTRCALGFCQGPETANSLASASCVGRACGSREREYY
jgi:hypothetical protein